MSSEQQDMSEEEGPQVWEQMLVDPNTPVSEIIMGHYQQYGMQDGPLTKKTTQGVRERLTNEMRELNMKTSHATTNLRRYQVLCCHYVPEERHQAEPKTYKRFPLATFGTKLAFWIHFYGWIFAFLQNPSAQFVVAFLFLWYLHLWSHQLYMTAIPELMIPYSCAKMPIQWHCGILNAVQNNTFTGIHDMRKAIIALFVRTFVSWVTTAVSRKFN